MSKVPVTHHAETHLPDGEDPLPATSLANAVMKKNNSQTIGALTTAQVTLDSSTFATTDDSLFSASGSDILIASSGLYVAFAVEENDNFDADPTMTQFGFKWLTSHATGSQNQPNEQILPKTFNVNGLVGFQGFLPDGSTPVGAQTICALSWAYCSDPPTKLQLFYANLLSSSITFSTAHIVVVRLAAIDAATLTSAFPLYP